MTTDSAGVGSFQLIQLAQVSMAITILCTRNRNYGEAIAQPIQNSLHTLLKVQMWCTHCQPLLHSPGDLWISQAMLGLSLRLALNCLPKERQHISTHIGNPRFIHNMQI